MNGRSCQSLLKAHYRHCMNKSEAIIVFEILELKSPHCAIRNGKRAECKHCRTRVEGGSIARNQL